MTEELERRIAAVRWRDLAAAGGDAREVPQALLGIASPHAQVRQEAYWKLDNNVVVQSDLYESAYFVIPFLIDYLRCSVTHGRELIYDLLIEIAYGYAPDDVMCDVAPGVRAPLMAACQRALAMGLDVFRRDEQGSNPPLRSKAACLAGRVGAGK